MGTNPGFVVRRATANDRDDLYSLAEELATSFEPSPTAFAESLSSLVADPDALVLVAAGRSPGRLTGYLLGFRHETFFAGGPVGWVEEVYVRADRRREGIAGALMSEFEHWAWEGGARLVALATRRANAFYEAIGYEESAVYLRKLATE